MSLQFDQLNNQLKTNDSTNANASMVLTPAGTGSVLLNGTGQNLLTYSASLPTGWAQQNVTATTGQADPFGGTTAISLNDGVVASAYHYFTSGFTTGVQNTNYTVSVYAKAGTANYIGVGCYVAGPNGFWGQVFNLTTGASTGLASFFNAPISYSSVDVGNGWWRFSVVFNSTSVSGAGLSAQHFISENGTSLLFTGTSKTILFAGPQLEFGSIANTYVPTTTTTIYNAPVLSLSGVANIGLQSDGALYVQPAGTGAIQAQATTSSATGGNARGQNAVDWQTARAAASQVASGVASVISGGINNTSTGNYNFVGGGQTNAASFSYGGIASGASNTVTANYSFIGGGNNNSITNSAASNFSFIGAGAVNVAHGIYNVTVGGFTNAGTSASAVTTQSATMNGTTAVTLSGSNASIKVGQYISGTSIGSDTYVAAISGTSLTLSKIATGSTTNTLTFYTPHGVVVGGGNNTATGSYSFIGGGGDAGSTTNRNVASGDWSFVGGGARNTASGIGAVVVGGGYYNNGFFGPNNASADISTVGGGLSNNASAFGTIINGGYANTANATYAAVLSGSSGNTRSITGYAVISPSNAPLGGASGSCQVAILNLAKQTTDATPTVLTSDGTAGSTGNQVIMPNNSAYYFRGEIVSGVTGGGNTKGWYIEGVIKRGANAASTALVGTPTVTSTYADAGAATWALAVTADTTNGGLAVTFTGQASTTIRTVAQIRTTEMTY